MKDDQRNLRRVLLANAGFSAVNGMALLIFTQEILSMILTSHSEETKIWGRILALGLVLFALVVYAVARRPRISEKMVKHITLQDILWVVSTILLLVFGWIDFSDAGHFLLIFVACCVAMFAIGQITCLLSNA